MTSFSRSLSNPASIRQSVIEAVRRLETRQDDGPEPDRDPPGDDGFRRLIDGLLVPVLVIQGGIVRYANARACSLIGIDTAEDLIGRHAVDLVPPQQGEHLSAVLHQGEHQGKAANRSSTRRFTLAWAQSRTVPVDLSLEPLRWAGGNAVAVTLTPVDGRDALSADRLIGVTTEIRLPEPWMLPDAEWISGIEVAWSDAGDRDSPLIIDAVGVEIDDEPVPLVPLPITTAPDRAAPSSFDGIEPALAGLSLKVPSFDPGLAAIIESAPVIPGWEPTEAIRDLKGEPIPPGAAPAELETAQRLSETALGASTDGIAILDASADGFPVIYVNAAFETMFGQSFEEAVGRRDDMLFGDAVDQPAVQRLRQAMANHQSATARAHVPVTDGLPIWCDVHLSIAREPAGQVSHFILVYDDISVRIAEEERARQAIDRLEAFTHNAAEWFWEFDADLRYAYASDRYFEITGDRRADILGKTIYEFQQGVETDNLDSLFATLESAQPFSGHVFSRPRTDGTVVWFSSDGSPIVNEDGEFTGYRGAARDITAELAARRALRENVERHRNLTSRLPGMIFQRVRRADRGFDISFISDVAREIFGLEPAEIAATPELLVAHIHSDDREAFEHAFHASADTMEPVSVEVRLRDVRGHEKWILISVRPSPGEGRSVVWDCLAVDVTAQKRPAVQIQKARDLYRAVMKNDARMICCLDRHGNCTFANAPFATFFGIAPSEVLNRRIGDMLPADLARRIQDGARRIFEGGGAESDVIELSGAHGSTVASRLAWTPLASQTGVVDQVQVTCTDVTELQGLATRQRETERHLGLILNAGAQQIAYLDRDQRYRFNNPSHQESFAEPNLSANGRPMREVLGDAAYRRMLPHVEAVLAGENTAFDWSFQGEDGTRHYRTTLTPDISGDGEIVGFLFVSDDVTDRRRLEYDVDEREKRYYNLAANLPGVVYQRIVDWQGRLSFALVSDGIRDVLGVEPAALLADPDLAHRMVHPDDLPRVKEAMESSRINLVPYDIEVRCRTRDGDMVWLRSIAHPYLRAEDNAVVWDGLLIDITALRRVEEARREIDQRYGRLVELSPDGIVVHDGERVLFANGPAARMHDAATADALVGRPWSDLIHTDNRAEVGAAAARSMANGGPSAPTEHRRVRLDGSEFLATISFAPVTWQGGQAALSIVRDITGLRAIESALRGGEQRLRLVIDRSPDAIYVISGEKIVYANDACSWLLGVSDCDDLIGATAAEFAAIADTSSRGFDGQAAEAGAWHQRAELMNDGTHIHFEEMVVSIEWKDQPSRLVICRDVTERVRTERVLAITRAEAARLSTAVDLAKEDAESANRSKTRFLAGLNREIRTPLSGIIGMSGLLIDSTLGEDQRQHVQTIRHTGKALLNTLNDVIEFARLRDGETSLRHVSFETRPTLEAVLELLASHAYGKGIDLAAYVAPNVPEWLDGDPGRLRQILLSLVANAIRFTDRGAVTVKVNLAEEVADGRISLFIRVTDTGCGIDKDVRHHMFENFNRIDPDGAPSGGGMGLGLAICRELVGLMGGEIGLESEPGVGSTFWVKVGMGLPKDAPETPILSMVPILAGRQVLLVGGNAVTRRLLHKQLRAFGMSVAQASNADQALAALVDAVERRSPFDLAMVDLSLPDMDPSELAQRIREQPCHRDLKLVLIAPTGRNIGLGQARQLGFDAALKKPLRQDSLINRTAALFGADVDERWLSTGPEQRPLGDVRLYILLVEDNPANREITANMLIRSGHRVDVANNGIEAVNAVRHVSYDLVLMDTRMPEMDGVTAVRMIRALTGQHAQTPIIGLASGGDVGAEACHEAGVNELLPKPLDPDTLAAAIVRLRTDKFAAEAIVEAPQKVPEITPKDRRELKDLLASLDDIMEQRR